jgi:PKD repeat protein
MSEIHRKALTTAIATALLLTPLGVLAGYPPEAPQDWPVPDVVTPHETWYNWTLDDAAGFTLTNTSMQGGNVTLGPDGQGNFTYSGDALSSEAAVTWGPVPLLASLWWWVDTNPLMNSFRMNYSWSDDNLSWSPEATLAGNGSALEISHAFYRWSGNFTTVDNTSTPVLWWVGLRIDSNTAPLANAGADIVGHMRNTPASLDGSLSGDGDLDVLSYLWLQTGGPTSVPISNPTAAVASVTPVMNGLYTFELNVTDGWNYSTDSMTVDVLNGPPAADAGPDQVVPLYTNVTLNASASTDPNGDPITFLWTQISGTAVTLNNATEVMAWYICSVPDVYQFNVTVTDNQTASSNDTVQITCNNAAPVVYAGLDQNVPVGTNVTLDGSLSYDPDALDVLSYQWVQVGGTPVALMNATQAMSWFDCTTAGVYDFNLTVTDNWGANATDAIQVTCTAAGNNPPVAEAGAAQVVFKNDVVLLDGSASSDPDLGDILSYSWVQLGGPRPVTLLNPTTATPSFLAPNGPLAAGIYTFNLTVTDTSLASSYDWVDVTSNNRPPVANAGTDQDIVGQTSTVLLDGSASGDPDLDTPLMYLWVQTGGNPVTINNAFAPIADFTAAGPDILMFNLTVDDGDGGVSTDDVQVNVTNAPPVAALAANPATARVGELVELTANASSDPDVAIATYDIEYGDGTGSTGPVAQAWVWHAYAAPGVYQANVTVVDTDGSSATANTTITVNLNQPPLADAGPDNSYPKGGAVQLDGSASGDPDFDPLSYAWSQVSGPVVTLSDPAVAMPTFTPTVSGVYVFDLAVDDGWGGSDTDQVAITITNTAPTANAGTDQGVAKGALVTLVGTGSSDPDIGDAVATYAWSQAGGPPVTLSSTTVANPTFTPVLSGIYTFSLVVTDSEGLASAADTIVVTVNNQLPNAIAGVDQGVLKWTDVTLDATGSTDPDAADVLTYSWVQDSGPIVVTLTGAATATPSFNASAAGTYVFTVTVDDGDGGTDTDNVTVMAWGMPPTAILTATPSTADPNTPITIDGSASNDGLEGDAIVDYAFDFGDGNTTSGASATVTHAYTMGGNYTVRLVVTDSDGNASAEATFIVSINTVIPNRAPDAVATASPTTVYRGTLVTLNGSGSTDPDLDSLTYAWTGPSGITITGASSSAASFSTNTLGTYTFTLTVSDGALSDTATVTVTVGNRAPVADAGVNQNVTAGTVVTLNGAGSRDDDPSDTLTFTWSFVSGPSSATLNSSAVAQPTFTATAAGTYVWRLIVSDGIESSAPDDVSIIVTTAPAQDSALLIMILIIVIVVVLLLALLFSRRKKKPEEGEAPQAEEPAPEADEASEDSEDMDEADDVEDSDDEADEDEDEDEK